MEIMFIEARKKPDAEAEKQIQKAAEEFKKNFHEIRKIGLLASLQYLDFLPVIKKELENSGIRALTGKGRLAKYPAQVLGCDINAAKNIEDKVQAFILISTGRFHAIQIAKEINKPVFILNAAAEKGSIQQIKKEDIEGMKRKRLGAVKRFLASNEIGIIVSTKHGQNSMKEALKIKGMLEKKGKKAFLFIADTINIDELENFSCETWINTACPALTLDSAKIVNWQEIEKFLKTKSL